MIASVPALQVGNLKLIVCCMLVCRSYLTCRDRMSEVLSYLERNMQDLDTLAADVADAAEEAAEAQGP
jgi:hypothetical protein